MNRLPPGSVRPVLAIALALGVSADLLLRATPWGLNAALWTAALAAAAIASRRTLPGARPAWAPLALAGLFALGFAWRASPTLHGLLAFAAVAAWTAAYLDHPSRAGWTAHVAAVFAAAAAAALAPLSIAASAGPGARRPRWRPVLTAAIGSALALPLLLVFGVLFASADPVFARYVTDAVHAYDDALGHVAVTALAAWVTAGLLAGLVLLRCPATLVPSRADASGGGPILVALALVASLFLAFLAVQARVLFGGHEVVEATTGLSYAEYARQGFFQLVACAAIALPILAAADWAIPRATPDRRRFVAIAAALALMVLVVLASAARRMALYVDAYGLTELRFYSSAAMAWLALACVAFGGTVLRGDRRRFAAVTLGGGAALVAGLALLDPSGTIVRFNLARAVEERAPFDARYAASLGADAVPALLGELDRLPADARCTLAAALLHDGRRGDDDWRTWNYARARARRLLAEADVRLAAVARSCPGPSVTRRPPPVPAQRPASGASLQA